MDQQLQHKALTTLFTDTVRAGARPAPRQLTPDIIQHFKSGADAPFIAALLRVDLVLVMDVIDREQAAQASLKKAQEEAERKQRAIQEQLEAARRQAEAQEKPRSSPQPAAVNVTEMLRERWPEHDVDFSPIQLRMIRYARNTLRLPVASIARAMRTRPEQIERIAADLPLLPSNTGVENDQA